jgi:Tol biopolymer transport system component
MCRLPARIRIRLAPLLLVVLFEACGGDTRPAPPPPPSPVSDIAFASRRALDGSDAPNSNSAENIWTVSADGTVAVPLTKLTANGIVSRNPAWSPDKTKIAFDSNRAPDGSDALHPSSPSEIWAVDADGTRPIVLTTVTDLAFHWWASTPAWSPDGLRLSALNVCCLELYSNVAILSADGSNYAVLTNFSTSIPNTGTGSGRWSANGLKLLFDAPGAAGLTVLDTAPQNIWVMNADGSGQAPLTNLTSYNAHSFDPRWSPDASEVVFSSSRALDASDAVNTNGTINIWVMQADGTGAKPLTRLTAAAADCEFASWSPDGTKLVFESARALDGSDATNTNQTVNIWVVGTDGGSATPLTNLSAAGASSHHAAWSPDGSKLVFDSRRSIDGRDSANNASNIWIMNADGSAATPLTKITANGADSIEPIWRP